MAGPYYVRSTTGNNANAGTSWALAKATLAGAVGVAVAGDIIYVSQAHAESTAATVSLAWPGTVANPNRIICGNDGAQPPTALATTATASLTGSSNWTMSGTFYCYGIVWNASSGTGGSFQLCNASNNRQVFDNCSFVIPNTLPASGLFPCAATAPNSSLLCEFRDCSVKFGAVGQGFKGLQSRFRWSGGSVVAGGTTPTTLFVTFIDSANIIVENVDFSNFGTSINWVLGTATGGTFIMRNCKFPTSWAGTLISTAITSNFRAEMYNCDTALTSYRVWIEDYAGVIRDDTTILKTGGITDEAGNQFSLKLVTNANAKYPITALATMEFAIPHTTSGSSTTVTGNLIQDNATKLLNNDCWITVMEPGSSSSPVNTNNTSAPGALTAGSSLLGGSATWTGTGGMTNPDPQDVAVTFTPNIAGSFNCRFFLGKASQTIYFDPRPVVT